MHHFVKSEWIVVILACIIAGGMIASGCARDTPVRYHSGFVLF